MFGDFLRQKETSIPNDLTRMVSLRQSQTRRRIESNSIFEHTHYSKSKGINKSLLLRTTSVSGVGGGGGREGACWALSETGRPHVIYTNKNWTTKRFWGQQSKNKSQGQAQPGGAKKTEEEKVGWPTIFAMFILVEWQYFLVFSRELNNFAAPCLQYTIRLQICNLCCLLGKERSKVLQECKIWAPVP